MPWVGVLEILGCLQMQTGLVSPPPLFPHSPQMVRDPACFPDLGVREVQSGAPAHLPAAS